MKPTHKILCLYSGGIDSTGMIWNIINNPQYKNYDILVHHVHLINYTNRFNAEKNAVEQIIPLLQKYSSNALYFSSSIMDFAFMGNKIITDADIYGFVAANLANIDKSIKYIAIGRTLDDKNAGGNEYIQISNRVMSALETNNYMNNSPAIAQCITPIVELTKKEIWHSLPAEIQNLTWSCRTPIIQKTNGIETNVPCDKCHACIAVKQLSI